MKFISMLQIYVQGKTNAYKKMISRYIIFVKYREYYFAVTSTL